MRKTIILFVLIIFLAAPVFAQPCNDCECGTGGWEPVTPGPVTTWTAHTVEARKFLVQPFFFCNIMRGVFNEEGKYKSYTGKDMKYEWQEQLFTQYGVTDRFEIGAQATYQQDIARQAGVSAESSGFADTFIYARFCAVKEKDMLPCVTGIFQFKMPTGKYQKADEGRVGTDLMGSDTGGGSYDHGYGVNISKKLKPFIFHADLIYTFPLLTYVDGIKTQYADYLNLDFAAEWVLPKGFNLLFECNGLMQADRKEESDRVPDTAVRQLAIVAGIGWSCDKFQTLVAYQRSLAGANIDANDSIVTSIAFTF